MSVLLLNFGIPLGRLNEFDFSCFYFKVMDVLMALQRSQMETDDPTTSYMLQVCFNVDFNGWFLLETGPFVSPSHIILIL